MTQEFQSWHQPHWVAVVDDDAQIAQTLKLLLSFKGVRASVHGSAESLLSSLHERQGRWWLQPPQEEAAPLAAAVLDLHLPGMSGVDLSLHLRQTQADLKVVMATAARDELLRERELDMRGVTCLSKPFDLEALEAALLGV